MLRGHQSLFQQLFNDEVVLPPKAERKGRSEILNSKRNELLITRYYYYAIIAKQEKRTYEWVLLNLENEFFLSKRTIADTIAAEHAFLMSLKLEKPSFDSFKEKYPFLIWRKLI